MVQEFVFAMWMMGTELSALWDQREHLTIEPYLQPKRQIVKLILKWEIN